MTEPDNKSTHPVQPHHHESKSSLALIPLIVCFALGILLWFVPPPTGMSLQGWHILDIFVITILSLMIKPLPMGACAIISLVVAILTNVLTVKQAFAAFSNDVVWLVVFALFI